MKTTFIYTLSDIRGDIRYVGKSNTPRKRLYSHIKECKTDNKSHKINWVKSLINKGELPIIEILEEVSMDDWQSCERYWIDQLKQWGFNLTNIATGGINGNDYKRSDETKEKMKKSRVGLILSDDHKKNISDGIKKKFIDDPNYNKSSDKDIFIDVYLLQQKYITENLSLNKCATFFGVAKSTIFKRLKENNISKLKSDWIEQISVRPKRPVLQYDINMNFIKEWESTKIVLRTLGIKVIDCCKGRNKTRGGFIWRYKIEN